MNRRSLLAASALLSTPLIGCTGDTGEPDDETDDTASDDQADTDDGRAYDNSIHEQLAAYESASESFEFDSITVEDGEFFGSVWAEDSHDNRPQEVDPLERIKASNGFREAIAIFGTVLDSRAAVEALVEEHFGADERAFLDATDLETDWVLLVETWFPQSPGTHEVNVVGQFDESTAYIGTGLHMGFNDTMASHRLMGRIAAQTAPKSIIVGQELTDGDQEIVGHAINKG